MVAGPTIAERMSVLADPTRQRVLELLRERPHRVGDLAARLPVSGPAVSQHLKVLRESGFAHVRADGPRRIYAVDATPLRAVDAWMSRFRGFWAHKLDALATEVARGKKKRRK